MKIKALLLSVAITTLSFPAVAQLSVGGHLSHLNMFEGAPSFVGFGLRAGYTQNEKMEFHGGINTFLSKTEEFSQTAFEIAGGGFGETINVPVENTIRPTMFYVGFKYYFVGDAEESFGVYALAQGGYIRLSNAYDYSFDESVYEWSSSLEDGSLSNFIINLGVGFELDLDFAYLYAEPKFNLAATEVGGQAVAREVPNSLQLNIGLRIPLDL